MKHLIFLVFVFAVQIVFAQEHPSVKFGIRAGANFSHMNFSKGSPPPESAINTNWQPGLTAGVLIVVPLTGKFSVQPEYLISQMGGKVAAEDREYVINYMSLPVLLHWKIIKSFSLVAGPQFDLFINGKDKTGNNSASLEREIEHRSIYIIGGLEYSITENLVSGLRYMNGFNHVGITRKTGLEEFKYDGLQLYISYLF